MKRPEETMRALSQEELEQMLQNDFLMASSCDAEQVVQVVETSGPGGTVGSSTEGSDIGVFGSLLETL